MSVAIATVLTWSGGFFLLASAAAAEPAIIPLHSAESQEPPADREHAPTMTVYLPEKQDSSGTGIIICPGGGYGGLAMEREGQAIARRFNRDGLTAFVLKYRHRGTGHGHPAPLADAQQAIRLVRSRAEQWRLRPDRIGILGFSAGGHLASTAGTHFEPANPDATDPLHRVSSRPDFMVLIYPVITMSEPYMHAGSRNNLIGENPDPALATALSSEKQVTARTPPTFLVHTSQDRAVPVENSLAFYQALRREKVPAELHIFEQGRHGFDLGKPGDPVAIWPELCNNWLRLHGFRSPVQPAAERVP